MVHTTQTLTAKLNVDVITAAPLRVQDQRKIGRILGSALNVGYVTINEKIDPSLLGGFQIQIGSCLIDLSVSKKLQQVKSLLSKEHIPHMSAQKLVNFLSEEKQKGSFMPDIEQTGRVVFIKDNIVRVEGMKKVQANELIRFSNEILGIVFNVNTQFCDVVLLSNTNDIKEGSVAKQTGTVLKVPVGKALLGRTVNALCEPLDNKGNIKASQFMPIEAAAPGIIDRQPVNKPFLTGTKVIDALVPIGLGQRELIIGDRQTGKTTLILDAILNQKYHNDCVNEKEKIYCVYVAIGQKQSSVSEFVHMLEINGSMDYTCVVCANASDTAAQQYIAPFTATTIAEYFRDKGMNVVVFYDDLSKHANAYRQLSLLLRRPPGREAYPGDIFYLHSRLLERAAMMSEARGGGSLTAIPVVETQESDVSAYIPTNIISITDGQIFLDTTLFNQNIRPAVNVGLSVSRIGSKAQYSLISRLSSSMKLELSQYREILSFAQIASDLDFSTQQLLEKGAKITESLKQAAHMPLCFCDEFLSLYAVNKGFFEKVPNREITALEADMLSYIHEHYPDVIDLIDQKPKELSRDNIKKIDEAIKEAFTWYLAQKDAAHE